MKIVSIGSGYEIYNDDLKVYDTLPAGAYHVDFSKMSGFSLSTHPNIEIKEKVYGVHDAKTEKVLDTYNVFQRNLGVILSGNKGIGKSMFAKLLCIKAIQRGIPVIIVDQFIPGIARYIESIEQEVVVLFDEFDKTFGAVKQEDGSAPCQTELLGLFDGISPGKKLFVITCNELRNVSEYLVNRPGRFHYHFRFEYPSSDEIREYLRDNIKEEFYGEIDNVVAFASRINLNYDCLRSIAFELNKGEAFKELINDLNIVNITRESYNVEARMSDGTVLWCRDCDLDLFSGEDITVYLRDKRGAAMIDVAFSSIDVVYDSSIGCSIVPGDCVSKEWYDEDSDEAKRLYDLDVVYLHLKKKAGKNIHYAA